MRQAVKTPRVSAGCLARGLECFRAVLRARAGVVGGARWRSALCTAACRSLQRRRSCACVRACVRCNDMQRRTWLRSIVRCRCSWRPGSFPGRPETRRSTRCVRARATSSLVVAECRRLVVFQLGALRALLREIATRYGFQLHGRAIELHGRSKECGRARCCCCSRFVAPSALALCRCRHGS